MSKVTFKYPCGIEVKCAVTGLRGIVTSRLYMMNGCIQYCIQPKCAGKSTTVPDALFADEQIVSPVGKKKYTPDTVDFVYAPGDKLRSRLNGLVGIVRYVIHDMNGCQRVEMQGEWSGKEGKAPFSQGIIQEYEYVSAGLNDAKKETPVKKTGTGCSSRRVSVYDRG